MPLTEDRRRQLDDIVMRMEGNREPESNIRAVVEDFKQKYGNYTEAAPQPEQHPDNSTFAQRIGFGTPEQRTPFGLPKGVAQTVFPRTSELPPEEIGKMTTRSISAGAKDVLSLPGRALAASPAGLGQAARAVSDKFFGGRLGTNVGDGETFVQSVGKAESENIGGQIVRDPMLPLSIGVGAGATKLIGPGKTLIGKVGAGIGAGALEGLAVGGAKQAADVAEGEKFDLGELGAEVGGSALFGGMSEAAGHLLKYAAAPKLYNSAMKPVKATRLAGFDPENIVKYDVGGSFDDIAKRSASKIDDAKRMADEYLERFAATNPDAKVDVDGVIQGFLEDLDAGQYDQFFAADQLGAAEGTVDKILEAFDKRGYKGEIDLPTANKAKRWLGKGVFKKGPSPTIEEAAAAKVKELIDLRLRDKIQEIAPEIGQHNKVMRDLIPVRRAAEEAQERFANNNNILGMSNLVIGGSSLAGATAAGNPSAALAALPAMAANRFLAPGRGAALVQGAGGAVSGIGRSGGRSYIGGNAATAILNPEEEEKKREAERRMGKQLF